MLTSIGCYCIRNRCVCNDYRQSYLAAYAEQGHPFHTHDLHCRFMWCCGSCVILPGLPLLATFGRGLHQPQGCTQNRMLGKDRFQNDESLYCRPRLLLQLLDCVVDCVLLPAAEHRLCHSGSGKLAHGFPLNNCLWPCLQHQNHEHSDMRICKS